MGTTDYRIRHSLIAGLAYFVSVFGIGFILGTFRSLVLKPVFGESIAILLELPVILVMAWLICRWLVKSCEVPKSRISRAVMGGLAFLLLMIAEFTLSTFLFGNSVAEHFALYLSFRGALGLAGQVTFGLFPVVQR